MFLSRYVMSQPHLNCGCQKTSHQLGGGWCQYKSIFGNPNEGVHAYRMFNLAVVDVVFTVMAAWGLHVMFPKVSFFFILFLLFLLGIFCHHLFCVKTTVARYLSLLP
jgi:hypothetical protein